MSLFFRISFILFMIRMILQVSLSGDLIYYKISDEFHYDEKESGISSGFFLKSLNFS